MSANPIDDFVEDVFSDELPVAAWEPFPDSPQERAYHSEADIIGYGGQAGGGKSDLALGKAFTQFYNTIIYRREYPQLDGIIERGNEIQNGACRYIEGTKKRWLTPDGRIVKLGSIEHAGDVNKYKGRARDFIVFDEAADFSEFMVRFATGWLRTDRTDIKPQVLLTFNPPTSPEGEWIVQFFGPWIDPNYQGKRAEPGELRYFIRIKDKDQEVPDPEPITIDDHVYYPKSRTFFRARVEDNPVYMASGYDKHLDSLPEPLRSQLRDGDFSVSLKDDIWQAIPTQWIIEAQNRWIKQGKPHVKLRGVGVDPSRGGKDETAIAKLYGNYFEIQSHPGSSVPDGPTAAKLITDSMEDNAPIYVDVIGIGSSVYDSLKPIQGVSVLPVNVGAATDELDNTKRYHFFNIRAQIVWQFREALDPSSGEDIALPSDPQLRNDLRAPRFKVVSGKIQIETKDQIRERLGRSPDRGEAILLAWYGANRGFSLEEIERWGSNEIRPDRLSDDLRRALEASGVDLTKL